MMLNHYMKAVLGGIGTALVATGFNILLGLLIKWFTGDHVDQLLSIKHLFLFLVVLLLSTAYLTVRQPDRNE